MFLLSAQYAVETATSGQEALDAFQSFTRLPANIMCRLFPDFSTSFAYCSNAFQGSALAEFMFNGRDMLQCGGVFSRL